MTEHDETAGDGPAAPLPRWARRDLLAVGRAALPAGERLPAFGEAGLDRLEEGLGWFDPLTRRGYLALLRTVRARILAATRRPLHRADPLRIAEVLERMAGSGRVGRLMVDALLAPVRVAHASDPAFFDQLGCPFDLPCPADEPARWHGQVLTLDDLGSAGDLACDVVVVGSGAGGAVVACRLAEAGLAVLIVEEGQHFHRPDFGGRPLERLRRTYRSLGVLPLHGNTRLTLPLGRTLGGSTTINSGTCYRAPDAVLDRWARFLGLPDLAPERLAPHFERVERFLEIGPAQAEHLGGVAQVVARGCDALGLEHGPVLRNAPECDGQGTCAFGCPTGAKRSMDVSYIPRALRSGAAALVGVRAESITHDRGPEPRVLVSGERGGETVNWALRARSVVIAAGAIHTPGLLRRSMPGRVPRALGRGLTVHPACMALAVMGEPVRGWDGIPQSYAIESFLDQGLVCEGGFTPPDLVAAMLSPVGQRGVSILERYDRVAYFGAMIGDGPGGRVFPGGAGEPPLGYWLSDVDTRRLDRALRILCRVFLAAGAREVYPMAARWPRVRSFDDLRRLPRFGPGDLDLTAFHPLGTAAMGLDPATSVVDPDHRVRGLPNTFVVDGSVVPTSLGVNPQLTIMALAERAASGMVRSLR